MRGKTLPVMVKHPDRSTVTYSSIASASRSEGISKGAIRNRIAVHAPDRQGRMWYVAKEEE